MSQYYQSVCTCSCPVQADLHTNATVTGLGLDGVYQAEQIHFHWGDTAADGSEHTLDGRAYPMEVGACYNLTLPNPP